MAARKEKQVETDADIAKEAMSIGLLALRERLESLRTSTSDESIDLLAKLLRQAALVSSEIRKQEVADRKAAASIRPADIMDALRAMRADEREALLREAARIGERRNVLG